MKASRKRIKIVVSHHAACFVPWSVAASTDSHPNFFKKKDRAILAGRSRCRQLWGEWKIPAQLIIKGIDGKIQTEHTYGRDPRRYKG